MEVVFHISSSFILSNRKPRSILRLVTLFLLDNLFKVLYIGQLTIVKKTFKQVTIFDVTRYFCFSLQQIKFCTHKNVAIHFLPLHLGTTCMYTKTLHIVTLPSQTYVLLYILFEYITSKYCKIWLFLRFRNVILVNCDDFKIFSTIPCCMFMFQNQSSYVITISWWK